MVVFVRILNDKTVKTLKGFGIGGYFIHAVLLIASLNEKLWIMDNGRTIVELLPVCSNEDEVY